VDPLGIMARDHAGVEIRADLHMGMGSLDDPHRMFVDHWGKKHLHGNQPAWG
jgi:hypothetical protein